MLDRRSAVLIVGLPGSNRHRLGEEIVAANDHDATVLTQTCALSQADRPDQILRDILVDLGGAPETPASGLLEAIRQIVRAEHPIAPTLLLNDATFASPATLSSLAALAVSRDLRIIAAVTPETLRLAPALAAVAERIDLEPLDLSTITELLRARFGGTPHEVLVGFLYERSQGGYASLCQVADAMAEAGAIVAVEGTVILKPSLVEQARLALPTVRTSQAAARLGGSASITNLIDLVAVIGEVEISEAVACSSAHDVALAVKHGPLRQVDEIVSMVDPLESETVVAALDSQRLKDLWDAFAPLTTQSVHRSDSAIRAARWYLEVGAATPPQLAQIAAREANQRGLYHRTVAYTDTSSTTASALNTQHERAHALIQLGDSDGLLALFDQLNPGEIPTHELMAFMRWAPRMVPPADVPALREHAMGPDRPTAERNQRAASIALAELQLLAFSESSDQHIRRVRTLAFSGTLSPIDNAMAHTVLACFLRHSARPTEAVHTARIAVAMLESPEISASAPELDTARETLFMSLVAAQDLPGAAEVLRCYQAKGARYGRAGRLGPIMSGLLEFHRGKMNYALASLELLRDDPASQDVLQSHGWVEALAAQALIGLGRSTEAELLLAESESHPTAGLRLSDLERRITQAFVHDSLADPDQALEILADVAEEAHTFGLTLVELDALGLAVLVDGPSRTPALLDAVAGLVAPSGTPAMWSTFAPLAASFNFAGLIRLVDELVAEGQLTMAGRFAQYTLDSGRRATDLSPAARARLNLVAHPPQATI